MGLRSSVSGFIKTQRYNALKRSLQGELANLTSVAEGHKAVDLPVGHRYYRVLNDKAKAAITSFMNNSQKLGQQPVMEEIEAGAPQLRTLELLANGKEEGGLAGKLMLGSLFGGAGITILFAVYHDLYLALTHWANVRWGH